MPKIAFILLLFVFLPSTYAQEQKMEKKTNLSSKEEISLLIAKVENDNCSFHRNGKTYSAKDAANHLRLKLSRGARYAKKTEGFIKNLASKSSFSGKPYQIECQRGKLTPMEVWLNTELGLIRQ